jgi:hypothetical protein
VKDNLTKIRTAQLIIKVGDEGTFEDGDIINAFTDTQILNVHAQHITHPKNFSKNKHGLRNPNTLLQDYLENTSKFKFERISQTAIKRTDLQTGDEDILSDTPNTDNEYMDVPLYIERRLKHERHKIFGTPGNEYWYGGNTIITDEKIDKVWQKIEQKTSKKKADHTNFPFTEKELQKYYAITVEDFTPEEIAELTTPLLDDQGETIKPRKQKIDYHNLPELTAQDKTDIADRNTKVDHRQTKPIKRDSIITQLKNKLSFFFGVPTAYAATVTKTIGTSSRDYSTIQLWEDDLDDGTSAANDATAYQNGDDAIGEMYDDTAFDESVTIDGGGTVGLNSIKLTVPVGERHDGTAG